MASKKSKSKTKKKAVVRRKKRTHVAPPVNAVRPGKERYVLNPDFEFINEVRNLILKSSPAEKDKMIRRINGLGRVRLAVTSGVFLPNPDSFNSVADLVIVGDDINRNKLRLFLKALEAEVGAEIRFSLLDKEEFEYRYGMFDRFIRVLLEGPHDKIINKIGI